MRAVLPTDARVFHAAALGARHQDARAATRHTGTRRPRPCPPPCSPLACRDATRRERADPHPWHIVTNPHPDAPSAPGPPSSSLLCFAAKAGTPHICNTLIFAKFGFY
jgi:hypothetical protein